MYEYRAFQAEASEALLKDVEDGYNPLVAIPTGGGKTVIITRFIYLLLEKYPNKRVLILSHTESILKQDYETLSNIFVGIPIGLYSAGLNSRSIHKITLASVQTAYRTPYKFHDFDIAIIDECHLIPRNENSMYQKLFSGLKREHTKIGFSATIFRRKSGYLHLGKGAMFDKIAYDLTSLNNFNMLIAEGFLCKLIARATNYEMDCTGVKITAGDYNQKSLSEYFDRKEITDVAIREVIQFGEKYKSWLIFAIDIDHAEHIKNRLLEGGISAESLHTQSDNDRHEITDRFKNFEFRALVSVGMITTGFDAPNVDLIAMLRPTRSPVLHVQTAGRGTRPFPGKDHCLFLDFAGNTRRLGPINAVKIPNPNEKKKSKDGAPVKICENCQCYCHIAAVVCPICETPFPIKQKLKTTASSEAIIAESIFQWLDVTDVRYMIHTKIGKPDSLRVQYVCGLTTVNEFVCLDHDGYAGYKAEHWVRRRWSNGSPPPETVKDLFAYQDFLEVPTKIKIKTKEKYFSIYDVKF
jgi:DNA repair protein RadD